MCEIFTRPSKREAKWQMSLSGLRKPILFLSVSYVIAVVAGLDMLTALSGDCCCDVDCQGNSVSLVTLVSSGNFIYKKGWCGRFSSSSKPETPIVAVSWEGGVVANGIWCTIRLTFIVFLSNNM